MIVIKQDWWSGRSTERISLSRDIEALNEEKNSIAIEEESTLPQGDPQEITIPDDSAFVEMVKLRGTVFLNDNEFDIVYNSPEYQ